MDSSAWLEWRTIDVVNRPTENTAFQRLETLAKSRWEHLSKFDLEVLALERQCLISKPHFGYSLAARATWITNAYNKRYGHGLAIRQTISILAMCSRYMNRISIIERN